VPALIAFAEFVNTSVIPALSTMGGWISETLIPALREMWTWFSINILPTLAAVADVISAVLVKAFEILSGIWEDLSPVIETFIGWIDGLLAPINGIAGAVEALVGWLHELADAIRNQPDPNRWYKGESPSPFETSMRGIAEAIEKEVNPQLGKFALAVQGMGGSDQRSYDYSRTTRVDQMNINNGRDEQGVMQVLRNMSRI
jgi:hypothetical protein